MSYDPGYQQAARNTLVKLGFPPDRQPPRFPRGDVASLRKQYETFIPLVLALDTNEYNEVVKETYSIPGYKGVEVRAVAYRKRDTAKPSSAIVYFHGGGMVLGSPELFEHVTKADVAATGVAQFSIDYRFAPENPHPTPIEDCYAALLWLSTNARSLGVDPARIGVMGLSAGGGLAAGAAILARDRQLNPPLAKQILLEPMLDDCNTVTDRDRLPMISWSWDDNWTGWNALLGPDAGSDRVSEYAAPVRSKDTSGLAPAFIDVGTLDIFAKEAEMYSQMLTKGGVKVDWHLYQGVPHGFELRGSGSEIFERALANRRAAMQSF